MMIDYNVSDHWPADTPDWLKSLVSSLDRRHGGSAVLPLTVIVEEVLEWLVLASGVDAWKNSANRMSLRHDLDESVRWFDASLRAHITAPLARFQGAFSRLVNSPAGVLKQPQGSRADATPRSTVTEKGAVAFTVPVNISPSLYALVAGSRT